MDYKSLAAQLREFANRNDNFLKRMYSTIASSLEDDEFVEFIPNTYKSTLHQVIDLHSNGRDLSWIHSQQPNLVNELNSFYFICLAYLNDRKKNISGFESKLKDLEQRIVNASSDIEHISNTSKLITGATILAEYAKEFEKDVKDHDKESKRWLRWLVISVIGLIVILILVFFVEISELPLLRNVISEDIKGSEYFNILAISIKAALVFAYLQIPGFIKRNYFAEKHLEQAYAHRRNVLRSLHAVYNSLDDPQEKNKIITVGATIAFSESESGYITRKEGAGGEDLTETLLTKFWK